MANKPFELPVNLTSKDYLLHIGAFTLQQKRQDLLIEAFALSKLKCKLVLLGKGKDEDKIRNLIKHFGVSDRVVLGGFQTNPFPWIKHARLFILSSNYEDTFCFTYGDGIGNINISELISFHKSHGLQATLTASQAPGRFGVLDIDNNQHVKLFREKPKGDANLINVGFFVLSAKVFDLITDDLTIWERGPLEFLAKNDQLKAYKHEGFWQPMDTLRDKNFLEDLWLSGKAPWKVWQ